MTAGLLGAAQPFRSVFAGADVCGEAGLTLPEPARRPMFDDDMWDFTEVIGLPNQMARVNRRFDFAAIVDHRWRLVAKELILAMLAPRHDAVAPLARAYRTPLHLNTASGRLAELTRYLNWLTEQGVGHLSEVDRQRCEEYLAHRPAPPAVWTARSGGSRTGRPGLWWRAGTSAGVPGGCPGRSRPGRKRRSTCSRRGWRR
jgi:hypothetical protein